MTQLASKINATTPVTEFPDAMTTAYSAFLSAYPEFADTQILDELRAREYARLDKLGHIYLDYTGGNLYAESQLREHMALLSNHVFGNPHSKNPTSLAMTHLVEQARAYVLEFFHASSAEYEVIFTPNASGALKLVGESYAFAPGGHYAVTFDNHNSVNGIREFARARGATVTYIPVTLPELRVDVDQLIATLDQAQPGQPNLFAFPAQSNFSGVQHPLGWIEQAHARGWDVLVDCAAFAPSNHLDLGRWQPDFVSLSFYKIFGYPTGIGCLIARKSALAKLRRPWFAGGTITITSVQGEGWHFLIDGSAGFEDGTVNYLGLPAVEIGLRYIASIGIDTIHQRVRCLTGWLLEQMVALRHSNGRPVVRIYGPPDLQQRGGTIAFNLYDQQGALFDYRKVEALANGANISLRTGCFCNPGAGEIAHNITRDEMAQCFLGAPLSFDQFFEYAVSHGKTPSTIRISVGLATNFADVYRFLDFAKSFCDRKTHEIMVATGNDTHSALLRDSA
jgi:molybdenum cofactor sulfurtransferase